LWERNNSAGYSTAKSDFDSLKLSDIKTIQNKAGDTTSLGTTPNGKIVNLHFSSTESRWTIELGNIKYDIDKVDNMLVTHWKLDGRVDNMVMFLQDYHWNENGLSIVYLDESSRISVHISFCVRVEFFQFKFVEKSLYCEDYIYSLMTAADCVGPINPFFYQALSEDELKTLGLYIDADGRKLTKYVLNDHDTLITVISSLPPVVTISEE